METLNNKPWPTLAAGEVFELLAVNGSAGLSAEVAGHRQTDLGRSRITPCAGGPGGLRLAGIAAAVFAVVEGEKWLRFGRGRGHDALPE